MKLSVSTMQSHKSKDPNGYSRKAQGNGGQPFQYRSRVRSLLGFAPTVGVSKRQRRAPPVGFRHLDQQPVMGDPFDRTFPVGQGFALAEDQPLEGNTQHLDTYRLTSTELQQPRVFPDPSDLEDIQPEMVDRFDHCPNVHQACSNGSPVLPVQNRERPEPVKVELTTDDVAGAANLDIPGVSDQPIEFPNLKDPEVVVPPPELKSSNFSRNIASVEEKTDDQVKSPQQTAIVASRPEELKSRHFLKAHPRSSNSRPDLEFPEKPLGHFKGSLDAKQPDRQTLEPNPNFPMLRTVAILEDGQTNNKPKGKLPKGAGTDPTVFMASSSRSAGGQIDQHRRAVHNLSKKMAALKSAVATQTDQQQSESQRAETIQPIVIVNNSSGGVKKTLAFWERSYTRRFQLRPLR